jgi:hypothetical protein
MTVITGKPMKTISTVLLMFAQIYGRKTPYEPDLTSKVKIAFAVTMTMTASNILVTGKRKTITV